MKGEHSIRKEPKSIFRYGGILHDYDTTWLEWYHQLKDMGYKDSENYACKCYICGGRADALEKSTIEPKPKTYPYCGVFRITKGKDKGRYKFRIICRECAYDLAWSRMGCHGVIEMDGNNYFMPFEFDEEKYKKQLAKERGKDNDKRV